MEYYVYKDDQNLGPLSGNDVVLGLSTGRFRPNDLGCRVGASEWQDLEILFPNEVSRAVAAPPPPYVPQTYQQTSPSYGEPFQRPAQIVHQPPVVYQSSPNLGVSSDMTRLMYFEANKKSAGIAYLLLIFLGGFGAHRFYLNHPGSAIAQLLLWWGSVLLMAVFIGFVTMWIPVIWWFIDLFLIPQMVTEYNNSLLIRSSAFR
jgi:TM2 domain-containing membrane protein YozV